MADHKKMYSTLFNAITDAIEILQNAQLETEDMHGRDDRPKLVPFPLPEESKDKEEPSRDGS